MSRSRLSETRSFLRWPSFSRTFPCFFFFQANQNAEEAATDWCKELRPFQQQGSKVGSATAYNVKILTSMSKKIKEKCGGEFDFIAAHWYGKFNDLDGFKNAMIAQHNAFPDKKLWITEFATTASGGGNQQQVSDSRTWAWDRQLEEQGLRKSPFPSHSFFCLNRPKTSWLKPWNGVKTPGSSSVCE